MMQRVMIFLHTLFIPFICCADVEPKYQLSILAIFRDEAPYLKEWIEFHRLVGVEHFYLTNHMSKDNCEEILRPYVEAGIVDLDYCGVDIKKHNWNNLQQVTYLNKIREMGHETHWLAVIDLDEFLFPVEGESLVELLKDYEEYSGVCANWQMYGTSGVKKIGPDELLIEKLVKKAKTDFELNYKVKSIIKPLDVNTDVIPGSSCYFIYKPGCYAVDENKKYINSNYSDHVSIEKIRINHYWTRDEDYFIHKKIPSRKERRHSDKQIEVAKYRHKHTNKEEDTILYRFIPQLKERVFSDELLF